MAVWKSSKIKYGFASTATSAGVLSLTSSSLQYQIFTGSTTHSVNLPDATTLKGGIGFNFINVSTGVVSIYKNDGSTLVKALPANSGSFIVVTDISSANGVWSAKTGSTGSNGSVGGVGSSGLVATVLPAARGVWGGGQISGVETNTVDFIIMATLGNTTDFGDLTVARNGLAGCSSSTRGLFGGGVDNGGTEHNEIDYVTIATTGNAIDFGDLSASAARHSLSSCSNSTIGIWAGGYNPFTGGYKNIIDFVTIATLSNATDFGDLTVARYWPAACSSTIRGLFAGGYGGSHNTTIDYVTIATAANAVSFGNLTVARSALSSCSSPIIGVWAGGNNAGNKNEIDFVTIAVLSAATDFGDLTVARESYGACSSSIRGIFGGNQSSNVLDYIDFRTISNASDFGDLSVARTDCAGLSNAHGGLS